jgi:8-oxo-dGTP pyrophosphatase MutT (NUDIX family)
MVRWFRSLLSLGRRPPPRAAARRQVAALCWRRGAAGIEVLLVTSRETGRWVIPKGGLVEGLDEPTSAALEAEEEAGVRGSIAPRPVGEFSYLKRHRVRPCVVGVYPLVVETVLEDWLERDQRRREWVSPSVAAERVSEPELKAILKRFAPN